MGQGTHITGRSSWRGLAPLALWGLLGGLAFAAAGSSLTYPRLGAPLDDAFIHMQYARQFGDLNFYRYQDHAPASSGATSWLYLHVLGAFALLGFDGDALLAIGLLIGIISWAAAGVLTYQLAALLSDKRHAAWACAAVLSSGALLWAAASGMEVTAAGALLLASLLAYECNRTSNSPRTRTWSIVCLSLLALVRPEGGYAALTLWAPSVLRVWKSGERRALRAWLWVPLAFAIPYLTTLLTTGHISSNGLVAKSELHNPECQSLAETLSACMENGGSILAFFNGDDAIRGGWLSFAPPGLLLVAVCAGLLGWIAKARGSASWWKAPRLDSLSVIPMAAAAAGLWAASVSTLTYWPLHNYRYLLPLLPTLYVLTAVGLHRAESAWLGGTPQHGGRLVTALGLLAVVLQLTSIPRWSQRVSEESASIRHKQGSIAAWIGQNTQEDELIAINDAGLITYECGRKIHDLVGLMETQETALTYRSGEGAIYESFSRSDPRPDWFAVFPKWFEQLDAFDILGQPVIQVPDPFFPEMEKVVYRPSWASLGRADAPRASAMAHPDWRVIDVLDVGDIRSEELHEYRSIPKPGKTLEDPFLFRRNFGYHEEIQQNYPFHDDDDVLEILRKNGRLPDVDIVDAGRRHSGRERFTVHGVDPGKPLAIVIRTCDDRDDRESFHYAIRVNVDGKPLSDWHLRGTPWNWYERWHLIPADAIESGETDIEMEALPTSDAAWFVSACYWFCQPREPLPG